MIADMPGCVQGLYAGASGDRVQDSDMRTLCALRPSLRTPPISPHWVKLSVPVLRNLARTRTYPQFTLWLPS